MVQRVLLIVNLHKQAAPILMEEIATALTELGLVVDTCAFYGKPPAIQHKHYDVAITLGGDGTVLYAARCLAAQNIPIFPINIGTLGFIAASHPENWHTAFTHWLEGKKTVSRRIMIQIQVWRNGTILYEHVCLNDGVISASGIAKIIRLNVSTGEANLGPFRADGLIIATPTGSTAYSVAAGGPIVDPEMEAFIINPICPFTLSNRPMVVPVSEKIHVIVDKDQRSSVLLTIDGQEVVSLEENDRVVFFKAPFYANIISSDREMFYRVLKTKLNWSGGPDA
ncbi:MAG: NAD(+)/NADH kinase [Bacteroidales bacterium]